MGPDLCSASWARLIAKVLHADPLTCRKCGGKLKIVAYLHDTVAIEQTLDHLGLSPPEEPKPPPATMSCACRSMRRAWKWRRPEIPPGRQGRQISLDPLPPEGSSLPPQR